MENKENNIYEGSNAPESEAERLKKFEYPYIISTDLLGEVLEGKTVVDFGSGPNADLGKWVKEHGGNYVALDVQQPFLLEQKKEGNTAVRAEITRLPFEDKSVDVGHVRLVLMHLPSERRHAALQELDRVCKKIIAIDPNWDTFEGSEVVNNFRDIAIELLSQKSDLEYGTKIEGELKELLSPERAVESRVFSRGRGQFYDELIQMGNSLKGFAARFNPDMIPRLEEAVKAIEAEAQDPNAPGFILPEFIGVTAE